MIMQSISIFIFFHMTFLPFLLVRADKHKGPWDDEENQRVVDKTCECGIYDPTKNERPWTIFISRKGEKGPKLLCSATIITSDLLVTSHECLKSPGPSNNMLNQSELIISKDPGSSTSPFSISQVISSHSSGGTISDLVLIQVDPHFRTVSRDFSPICIPRCTDAMNDLVGQKSYFLGLLNKLQASKRSWDFAKNCSEGPSHTSTTLRPGHPPPQTPGPPTVPPPPGQDTKPPPSSEKDHCKEADESLLCLGDSTDNHAKAGDGVLIIDSASKNHRSFLVGVRASQRTNRGRRASSHDKSGEHIQFNKISGLIKYIEHHAAKAGSQWCHSDNLQLAMSMSPESLAKVEGRQAGSHWWEKPTQQLPPRTNLDCVCGLKNRGQVAGNIVGGEAAVPHEYPWLTYIDVHVFPRSPVGKPAGCTGQIINDRVVITAGHCVKGYVFNPGTKQFEQVTPIPADRFDVYVNAHYTPKANKQDSKMIPRKVARVYPYPDYETGRENYTVTNYSVDIALLQLDEPIEFTGCGDGIRPICIPEMSSPELKLGGRYAEIAGWGLTRINLNETTGGPLPSAPEDTPTELQKATIQILQKDACQRVNQVNSPHTVRELCTGNASSLNNAFRGDSGGPLMVKLGGTEQYTLVGSVSSGFPYPTQWMEPRDGASERKLPDLTHYVWYVPTQKFVRFIEFISNVKIVVDSNFKTVVKWCKSSI